MSALLVLGSGYLGGAIAALEPDSVHTSRNPARRSADRTWVAFDAADPTSWSILAPGRFRGVVVALPLDERLPLGALWSALATTRAPVVVIGSTSAFGTAAEVTDTTAIDPSDPRAAAEERWRRNGAVVLHSAGIYGPRRNPLDWLRGGRVRDLSRTVNLVHVADLARAARFTLANVAPGTRLVISDGHPRPWAEIALEASVRGWLPGWEPDAAGGPVTGKSVRPSLLAGSGFTLDHPDLLAELAILESTG